MAPHFQIEAHDPTRDQGGEQEGKLSDCWHLKLLLQVFYAEAVGSEKQKGDMFRENWTRKWIFINKVGDRLTNWLNLEVYQGMQDE